MMGAVLFLLVGSLFVLSPTIAVAAGVKTVKTGGGKTATATTDPSGNDIEQTTTGQTTVVDIIPSELPKQTFNPMDEPTYTVAELPASTSTEGYVSPDGGFIIPPKSDELLAYESQTGIISEPVIVVINDGTSTTTITGYQNPPPIYAEDGGYWLEGEYFQPSGTSYEDTLESHVITIQQVGNDYMCEIPDRGWTSCSSTGQIGLSIIPLAKITQLSMIRFNILG